jgi:glycosyltransferase involved in cell wall biosynthesis
MRITFLATSSLDYPSPRGRWLPLAQELVAQGDQACLALLHHAYDQLPPGGRRQELRGVHVEYVAQMHVYGPIGRRRYFGPMALLGVSLRAAAELARAAVRLGGDAIHVCKPQPINGLAGLLAARALGCPLYVDCDDYEAGGNRFGAAWQQRLVRFWEDHLPCWAAGVTVNTRFLQRRCQALGVPAARVAYVPNGIAAARLAAPEPRQVGGLRAALGLGAAPVAAYVGTLSQTTHNVGLLLDAFALVARRMPAVRLLLVGDGEDRAGLIEQSRRLGLGERARFVGAAPRAAVPAYLALAACSIDPVADDAVAAARSPLKIVESLAAGVPVITGDVGDRAEMLAPSAGVLVRPGDAHALADAIAALLGDDWRRAQLAAGARRRAEAYRWDRLAQVWAAAYARGGEPVQAGAAGAR